MLAFLLRDPVLRRNTLCNYVIQDLTLGVGYYFVCTIVVGLWKPGTILCRTYVLKLALWAAPPSVRHCLVGSDFVRYSSVTVTL